MLDHVTVEMKDGTDGDEHRQAELLVRLADLEASLEEERAARDEKYRRIWESLPS